MIQDKTAIRDAATVIVLRDATASPSILMGQRGSKAAFMPNKFVFPGGAVDAGDHSIDVTPPLHATCAARLAEDIRPESPASIPNALIAATIRELWEETGLVLGHKGDWQNPPQDWVTFAETGHVPSAQGLEFVFRAITPPGRPRRFDARFFLVDATQIANDLDDFSAASDELSHLQWIPLSEARQFDLPFITEVVLAEVEGQLNLPRANRKVPFFQNTEETELFKQLKGKLPSELD